MQKSNSTGACIDWNVTLKRFDRIATKGRKRSVLFLGLNKSCTSYETEVCNRELPAQPLILLYRTPVPCKTFSRHWPVNSCQGFFISVFSKQRKPISSFTIDFFLL